MGYRILGITPDAINKTTTAPATGRRDFPVTHTGWTTFTGAVEKVEVKVVAEVEQLAISVRNGDCAAEILVSLQPDKINPNDSKPAAEQMQRNLNTLTKAAKTLGIFSQSGEIEPALFPKAKGKLITFAGKQASRLGAPQWREFNGRNYPKCSYLFNGDASALVAVTPFQLPDHAPAAAASGPATPGTGEDFDNFSF